MSDHTKQLTLSRATYGKDSVRVLIAAERPGAPDAVRDVCFRVTVSGRFEGSYRSGDNAAILPSDTLRRHVLATAASTPEHALEAICHSASARLLDANPHIETALVEARERPWEPTGTHTFTPHAMMRVAACEWSRGTDPALRGGVEELDLLLTRGSAFTGFRRDALTVQPEAHDRPLGGTLSAQWGFASPEPPSPEASAQVGARLLAALTDRPSNAVQQWLTAAATAVLDATPTVSEIGLQFASAPIAPLPAELAHASTAPHTAHERHADPVGLTEVRLARG